MSLFATADAPNFAIWGDSMPAGDGVVGLPTRWWYLLAAALGRQVNSGGVGGETYTQAAARQVADYNFPYRTAIYWAGHNSPDTTVSTGDMAKIASMVAHQSGYGRFLIMLPTISAGKTANDPTTLALRAQIVAGYPNNYVDVPGMLATHGDGSPNDNADIANGYTPRSLRAAGDDIHLNAAGQALVATQMQAAVLALEAYFTTPPSYLIIIAGHQSNMTGGQLTATGATIITADDPSPNIWQYSPNGGTGAGDPTHTRTFEQAIEPLRYPNGVSIDTNVGPALTYAKGVLAANPTKQIVIIPGGKGGTPLTDWVAGQPLFDSMVTAYNALRTLITSKGRTYALHSVIMSPLENEMTGAVTPAATATRLDNTIAAYRALSGATNVPIYLGAAAPDYVTGNAPYLAILLEGAKAAVRKPLVGVLGGYTGGSTPGDTVHYTNVANRARGTQLVALQARTAAWQSAAATRVTNISIVSQTITFTGTGAPYYTIHVGTPGQAVPYGDAGTDWCPNQDNTAGQVYTVTMPGSGDRDAYIVAHAYGGDSAPSPVVNYTAPVVVVPQALIQLDFSGEPNPMDAVPSIGTDTTSWNPTSSLGTDAAAVVASTTQNGLTIMSIISSNKCMKRAGYTVPAGDYTIIVPFFMSSQGGNGTLFAWGQASTNGDIYFSLANTCTNIKIGHTNTSAQVITTGAPLTGQNNKWHYAAVTWNDTTKAVKIRWNGTNPAVSGTIINRSASPVNSGGCKFMGYNADSASNGLGAGKMPTCAIWSQVLTDDQIDKWANDVATAFAFTYG